MIQLDRSILPQNSTPFERGLEDAFSVWSSLFPEQGPNLIEDIFFSLWNPQTIDEKLLPYLAYGLGVSIWPEAWGIDKKRNFVGEFLKIRAKQGTAKSIIAASQALGMRVTVTESSKAFVIRVILDTTGGVNIPTRDLLKTIRDLCEAFVPKRVLFILETVFFAEARILLDARAISIRVRNFSMASEPRLLLTAKGKLSISTALASGTSLPVKEFGFGLQGYEPNENQTAMRGVKERFPVVDIRGRDEGLGVHITCVANSDQAYSIGEAGLFDVDGNLLAILSRPDGALTIKIDNEDLVFGFDLSFQNDVSGLISSANPGSLLNLTVAEELSEIAAALENMNSIVSKLTARIAVLEGRART